MERHPMFSAEAIASDAVALREVWPRYSVAALRAAPLSTRARRERRRRVLRRTALATTVVTASLAIGLWASPLIAQLLGLR